jgi:DNA-binding transcriptional MerR regulator
VKISELSTASGVSIASIKFYVREGLLDAGERVSATRSTYSDSHAQRLRLIRALIDIGGLSVSATKAVLAAIDGPDTPLSWVFGAAQYAISSDLPRAADVHGGHSLGATAVADLVERRGWTVSNENPGVATVARVLDSYAELGQHEFVALIDRYADAAEGVAAADLDAVGQRPDLEAMAETVVIGTILGDALMAGLRRIAQEHVARTLYDSAVDYPTPTRRTQEDPSEGEES